MNEENLKAIIEDLQRRNSALEERERDLEERNEELLAQKEELTAAIEAFVQKSDTLAEIVIKLEERNNELDQILYRSSHDLRSPISSIEGLLHLMNPSQLPESYVGLHQFLLQKVGQMNDVLNALGTLAHASFDQIRFEMVNVSEVVNKSIDELRYLPNHRFLSFTCHISPDINFETDPFLFGILLKCVLSNAIIYRLENTPGYVRVEASLSNEDLTISVIDDGEGILPEARGKIFDMFYRGSTKSIGPGLGLYVANRIAQRFQGAISFESNTGKTVFKVVIPRLE